MSYIIAGLGNPGEEYQRTRHNTGRMMIDALSKKYSFPEFKEDLKIKALVSKGEIDGEKVMLVEPNNFMNNSGKSIVPLFSTAANPSADKKGKIKPLKLIVIYDDLDLPLGKIKISYNKSSGGHRGLESIIKAVKTEAFPRIRVGISPVSPSGEIKKPLADAVEKHIIGEFKKPELETLKKISKIVTEAVESLVSEKVEIAMGKFNS